MIKSPFCMPRHRAARKATRLSPAMSLLDRLRQAVFRLIMISALSRSGSNATATSSPRHTSDHRYDPHHSEAVADCIEFIKKSATGDSTDGGYSFASDVVGAPAEEY